MVSDLLTGSNASVVSANNGLGVALPFTTSLQVAVRDDPYPSALTRYWASYLTSHAEPVGEPEVRVDEIDGQPFLVERAEYGDGETHYLIDSLRGPLRWSRVTLDHDYYLYDEAIVGILTAWQGPDRHPLYLDQVDLLVRPHGYPRVLDRITVQPGESRIRFVYEARALPVRGDVAQRR